MDKQTWFFVLAGLVFTEIMSCVTGFVYWNKLKGTIWSRFPVYLGVISLVEIAGFILFFGFDNLVWNSRIFIYFGIPFQFIFFFWLFDRYFAVKQRTRLPTIAFLVYIACWLIEKIFISESSSWFTSFSYTVGNVFLLLLIIVFFIRFINSDEILQYKSSMMFWVSLGLLVFYLGTFPFYALRNTLIAYYESIYKVYSVITIALDYLMYILFIISFIWGKPR